MAVKSKTMQVNLLLKHELKKVPFEGVIKLFEQFINEVGGNIYNYDIFLELINIYRGKKKEEPEKTAVTNLVHAFFEFFNYLQNNRQVVYYDKKMTEITICHNPFNKGQTD